MEKIVSNKRIAMKTYIENDDLLPVYKMDVSDDKSGLLLLNALIENTFDYGFKYLTPTRKGRRFRYSRSISDFASSLRGYFACLNLHNGSNNYCYF